MDWQDIFNELTEEELQELTRLMIQRVERPRKKLRPVDLLFPAVFIQMVLLAISAFAFRDHFFIYTALGNLIVAGLAMLPASFLQKQRSVLL